MRVAVISLGCSKNLVNSEQMTYLLQQAGHEICPEPQIADAVVVNTCGFLESAVAEAVETIIEVGKYEPRPLIIAAGCMPERHRADVLEEMPEVSAVVGTGSFGDVAAALNAAAAGERVALLGDTNAEIAETKRILGTANYAAYIKVAEGCDNHCAYCIIPALRGKFRSRTIENIVNEARELVANGTRELTLVAQDTTRYGLDIYGKRVLPELLRELCKIEDLRWLRLHYLYPDEVTDELLDVLAAEPKCVPYLDIPIQHINDRILHSMGRRGSKADIESLVWRVRDKLPEAVLRTSLIVGLPGETDAEFDELCEFLRSTRWERAGVFEYSAEDGTRAAEMPEQVEADVKSRRRELIEELQSEVIDAFNARRLGTMFEVLCEGYDVVAKCYYGRSVYDAPEVDGKVFFASKKRKLTAGEFVQVKASGTIDGDLWGEVIC
ncbi:ribosomal protein S12 methylthiotransferase RimO [Clostridia bacterium]|nr:ribosomal protein S12 methylthiotransferase RimO [Clostridia bacterium]